METKALWNRVKKLIKAHKMTQKQFAKCINIPSGSFEGLIYHDREPILSLAIDMSKALGVTVEYLATGTDREIKNKRFKELADMQAAEQILKLSSQINKKAEKIKGKPKPNSA